MSRVRGPAAWVFLAVAVVACSGRESLPPGPTLVRQASGEMANIRSVSFDLEVSGDLGLLLIRRAEGSMTREGDAVGTVLLEQGQALIEYEVVISQGTYYLKGPTGDWATLPEGLASGISDPTILLDPQQGLASILAGVRGAATEDSDDQGGVAAYRVRGSIPADALRQLLPVPPDRDFVDGTMWIGKDRPVLLRADIQPPLGSEADASKLSIRLSDFNEPVVVTPPA